MARARRNLRGGPRYRQRPAFVRRRGRYARPARRTRYTASFSKLYRNPLTDWQRKTCVIYNMNTYLDPNADTLSTQIMSANNLYDPDVTDIVGGHQPMYHDNFSQLYSKYKVNMAKITVTVLSHQTSSIQSLNTTTGVITQLPTYAYKLFIINETTSTDYPTIGNPLLEEGGRNIKWRFVSPSLTGKLPKLKSTIVPHKLQNKSYNDDTLMSVVEAGPSAGAYFIVGACAADGTTNVPAVYVNIRVKYYVTYFDRKTIQVSN